MEPGVGRTQNNVLPTWGSRSTEQIRFSSAPLGLHGAFSECLSTHHYLHTRQVFAQHTLES